MIGDSNKNIEVLSQAVAVALTASTASLEEEGAKTHVRALESIIKLSRQLKALQAEGEALTDKLETLKMQNSAKVAEIQALFERK